MAAEQSQGSVEFQIYNNTKNITLKNPRTFLPSGHCSVPPRPLLPPGSKDSFKFSSSTIPGCEGILTYESQMFTLVIFFSNPMDHGLSPVRLGLEIFPVHLDQSMSQDRLSQEVRVGNLEFVYDRMVQKTFSPAVVTMSAQGTYFKCAQKRNNSVKVMATMSDACSSVVKMDVNELNRQM